MGITTTFDGFGDAVGSDINGVTGATNGEADIEREKQSGTDIGKRQTAL